MSEPEIHYRTCPLCEAMCGLEVHVADDQVTRIRADRDDVWSKGFICPKGTTLGHLHHDPDRLPGRWSATATSGGEVTWPRPSRVRAAPGRHRAATKRPPRTSAIPTVHNFSLGRYVGLFMGLAGAPDRLLGRHRRPVAEEPVVGAHVRGHVERSRRPTCTRTDYLWCGRQPARVAGQPARVPRRARRARRDPRPRRHGGRRSTRAAPAPPTAPTSGCRSCPAPTPPSCSRSCTCSSPRISSTSATSPTSCTGVDDVRAAAADFTPEAVTPRPAAIPADTIRRLTRALAAAPTAAVYGRIGTCNQEFGTLTSWLVDVVNVLTGNFDRPGGMMFGKPVAWSVASLPQPEFADGFELGRWKQPRPRRARGARPGAALVPRGGDRDAGPRAAQGSASS